MYGFVGHSHSNYHRRKVLFLYLLFAECPLRPWDSAVDPELKTCILQQMEGQNAIKREEDLGPFPRTGQGLSAIHSFPSALERVNRQ